MKIRATVAVALALTAWGCEGGSPAQPEAAPTPEPTAAVLPASASCQLAKMSDHGYCPYQAMLFYAQVEQGLDEVIQLHPEVFDLQETLGCDRCYFIKDGHAFYRYFKERMERLGFCVQCDEECGVKNSNAFNEQYDVIVSQGFIRRGVGAYRGTCYPAAF